MYEKPTDSKNYLTFVVFIDIHTVSPYNTEALSIKQIKKVYALFELK